MKCVELRSLLVSLVFTWVCGLAPATERTLKPVLILDLEQGGFVLRKDGALAGDNRVIAPRYEGHGTGRGNVSIVADPDLRTAHALHYLCGPQDPADHKARQEHYLHVAQMRHTYISEFSIKLDREFTPVETTRAGGGSEWCVIRQWHQCAPESPPIALNVAQGTNDTLRWNIISGDSKKHSKGANFGQCQVKLDHWYHFRVEWNVSPDEHGRCIVLMSDRKLPKDLSEADTLFRYAGPVGYTLKDRPDSDDAGHGEHGPRTIREQQGIYQGVHLDPKAHHGLSIANVAIYDAGNE